MESEFSGRENRTVERNAGITEFEYLRTRVCEGQLQDNLCE